MAREELKWQNIDADDLPTDVKQSFDAMIEAEAAFKAELEKLLKKEGHMPEDKFLLLSRKGKRLGVAYTSTPPGGGGAGSLRFKTKGPGVVCGNRVRVLDTITQVPNEMRRPKRAACRRGLFSASHHEELHLAANFYLPQREAVRATAPLVENTGTGAERNRHCRISDIGT